MLSRTLIGGFAVGAALGVYGNAYGAVAALIVVALGAFGALIAGGGLIAGRLDRTRLRELLGDGELP